MPDAIHPDTVNPAAVHPAALPEDQFAKHVRVRFRRDRGPGGQHRNKVETGVVATYTPLGIEAAASEKRSQADNRKVAFFRLRVELALEHRTSPHEQPSQRWSDRIRAKRLEINPTHHDFPALLAEALNMLEANDWNVSISSERLAISSSQLVKFLKLEPRAFTKLNVELASRGRRPRR
jgi:hypothetical protein